MDVFQQKTKIVQYATVKEFLQAFSFQRDDYILASRSIYETFFQDADSQAHVVYHSDYGRGEPDDQMLDAMLKDMRRVQPKRIIAIGGGSVIDCAKLFVFKGAASAQDMFLQNCALDKCRELIAIPTTCGSGSEVSRISICELTALQTKLGLAVDALYPDQAVLIPELLSRLPFFYFVTSGIDALIHASESYVSPKSNAYTQLFSKEAIRLLLHGFQIIAKEGKEARLALLDDFMRASNFAGIAFGNTGTGAVHALSYPLSGIYHVTHGEANYQFFTAVFQKYENLKQDSVRAVKELFCDALSCTSEEVFPQMEALFSSLLPKKPLREYGMQEAEITAFTDSVIKTQQRLLTNSAVPLSKEDIQDIYQVLY
ncbi:4-hydroxybutyrate dehydrogenase [[Clostridium] innocuum]|nr:4-hydroxybutyrate dehydrogenase [[Clostridium] innocuum]